MPKLPVPQGASSFNHKGSLPSPEGGTFNPFLQPKHLGKSKKGTIKLTGVVRDAPKDSFSDIFVECTYNGKTYDLGVRFSSGNYRRLFDEFGANPKKWKGTMHVGVKNYMKKDYVAIE